MSERLGYHGIDEIKKHPFFAQTNWEKMLNKSVYPPLVPSEFRDEHKDVRSIWSVNNSSNIILV